MMRRIRVALVALLLPSLLAAAFLWGYFAHRDKVFPYGAALKLAVAAGMVPPPGPDEVRLGEPANAAEALANIPYVTGGADPRTDLFFNNGRKLSEVVEMDPVGRRVVWRYRAGDKRMPIWRMTRFGPGDPRLPPGLPGLGGE